jgi:hypothetical protein
MVSFAKMLTTLAVALAIPIARSSVICSEDTSGEGTAPVGDFSRVLDSPLPKFTRIGLVPGKVALTVQVKESSYRKNAFITTIQSASTNEFSVAFRTVQLIWKDKDGNKVYRKFDIQPSQDCYVQRSSDYAELLWARFVLVR